MSSLRPVLFAVLFVSLILSASTPSRSKSNDSASIGISVPYELDSFDPHATITISNYAVLSNFYEPLVRSDAEMKVQPCLARSWENPESNVWIFDLETNARFHDGRMLTAEDVAYSLNRLRNDPELRMRAFLPEISKVEVLNPSTVK